MKRTLKKLTMPEWAMRYSSIIIMMVCFLVGLGVYGLDRMNKNEFPQYTIREAVIVTSYPGATSDEVEQQVTKAVEDFVFPHPEVNKPKTASITQDGLSVVAVSLTEDVKDPRAFWNKMKHELASVKESLPQGVYSLELDDDFGNSSAMLLTLESKTKTYKELSDLMDQFKDSLRQIPSVGKLVVYGMQKEQVCITLDYQKLSHYGISDAEIAHHLKSKGYITTAGRLKTKERKTPLYVSRSINHINDLRETVVFNNTESGKQLRLKDVAKVYREYPAPEEYITFNGTKCLLLSIEKKDGQDISRMGAAINEKINHVKDVLPQDVGLNVVNDLSKVVDDSVESFLHEIIIALFAVIFVVVTLMPFRVALVAASTMPVSIFISLGAMYLFGMEINTVTLAALIVTLGMIVDDSIVIIDGYLENLAKGMSRFHASIASCQHFFKSILSATMAISITFFPFIIFMNGGSGEFLASFPVAMSLILFISMFVAQLFVPIVQYLIIRKPLEVDVLHDRKKKRFSMLLLVQHFFDHLIDVSFAHKRTALAVGFGTMIFGGWLMTKLPQELMPVAERNQFAVEIYTPMGTSLSKTSEIADSLERMMLKDKRILSVASFHGMSSPRFVDGYAPQVGGSNFAQFIVNTPNKDATFAVLPELERKYNNYFPNAYVRFKQISYSEEANPVEVRIQCTDLEKLRRAKDTVIALMHTVDDLYLIRSDMKEPTLGVHISLNEEQVARLGVTNRDLEETLMMRYGSGMEIGAVWDGNYERKIVMKSNKADSANVDDVMDECIPVNFRTGNVQLRQIASPKPVWKEGQIAHRNGLRTATVMAEVTNGKNVNDVTAQLEQVLSKHSFGEDVHITYGGKSGGDNSSMPGIIMSLLAAVVIIFFILVWHFKNVKESVLMVACLPFCLLGTAVGTLLSGVAFSLTSILGVVSLMGILVRDGIILFDYTRELYVKEKLTMEHAVSEASKRRMRPILLTSLAASIGVLPMLISQSTLWMPMAAVISFGTIITLFYIRTVMPVLYSLIIKK